MPYGTGLDAFVGFGDEGSSYNQAATLTRFLPLISDKQGLVKHIVESKALRGGQIQATLNTQRLVSWREAKGPLSIEVQNQGMGLIFDHVFGSTSVSNSGSVYTRVHTLAGTKGKSLTCQVGRPSVDGIVNPFTYTGGKVVDAELVSDESTLLQLNLNMDYAAELTLANGPVISGVVAVGTAGTTTRYYRVSAIVGGTEQPAGPEFTHTVGNATLSGTNYNTVTWGAVPNASGYNVYRGTTSGGELKIASNVAGTTYNDQSPSAGTGAPIGPLLATPTYASTMAPFSWLNLKTLTLAGTPVAAIKKISIKLGNPLAAARVFAGSGGQKAEQVINGLRQPTGTIEAEFVSQAAMYAAFASDTGLAFQAKWTSDLIIPSSTTPYSVQIDMPAVFLEGETPGVSGPDLLSVSVPFTAYQTAGAQAISLTQVTSDTSL